jgi:hypothetical protein
MAVQGSNLKETIAILAEEAEYYAASTAAVEVIYLGYLRRDNVCMD